MRGWMNYFQNVLAGFGITFGSLIIIFLVVGAMKNKVVEPNYLDLNKGRENHVEATVILVNPDTKMGFCSAVIISEIYAVTAAHCAKNFKKTQDDKYFTLVQKDDLSEVQVGTAKWLLFEKDFLILEGSFHAFKYARINETGVYSQKSHLIGYPGGTRKRIIEQSGAVSHINRVKTIGGCYKGQSGGGLFDDKNQLIGVFTSVGPDGTCMYEHTVNLWDTIILLETNYGY